MRTGLVFMILRMISAKKEGSVGRCSAFASLFMKKYEKGNDSCSESDGLMLT